MAGMTGATRFEACRVIRGRGGGFGRVSGQIHHRRLLKGPRAHPIT